MLVKDFMIKDVVVMEKNKSLKALLELLVEKKIGGVPVVDQQNKLVGIISDGDVLRALKPKTYVGYYYYFKEDLDENIREEADLPIKKLMHKRVVTIDENADLEEALKLLASHHFKKIPVINEEKEVVGIISRGDMIKKLREKVLEVLNEEKK